MMKQVDVIVAGAGIAGSSSALQLARLGHSTILLDRQEFPRHKTCGEFMSPETKEMLEVLGINLGAHTPAPGIMDKTLIILSHGGEIGAPLPGNATGISRYELDRILHQQAQSAGAEIVTKAVVTGIRKLDDNRYEVETRQGDSRVTYQARAVIGAYGTRKPRGVAAPAEDKRDDTVYIGIKSHYSGIAIPEQVELYFCEGGYIGISPIEAGKVNIAALLTLDSVQGSGKSVQEILHSAARSNRRLADRLAEGTPVAGTQVSVAPVRLSDTPEPWSEFPHIGDAMLMIPPLCGDGMSIALRSALICSGWTDRYLRGMISYEEWQTGYSAEADQTFTRLLRRARKIQRLAFSRTNRLYPGLARVFPGLARYVVKATRLSETGMNR
ncbi:MULTISPECIES: NAD(P)/FAD-dependent oxidoreductase [unclassified Paenibacillus]|uniref:NAD(P)/FAD-dependent oxidoreductase n=1 Tax=unclassified Paenibacillus TaxID=185978 RepID=UPI00240533E5|nr:MULTISPECIES: NAD(P)/FAD-dependent oxidoreductase [unclassified Paenibacillus]MDF9839360.1 flavin-dependent dehydrogenase [Paenibacillus sp. PastF-2]MDF9845941.1 flavin-dependent dehydrogenase [Paenibacillus sp. PastM-2]MDF9852514.1 flavin-dependent dehydrogenase [Paenibacillus sp. PastF-1]MDH6477756.1 flavin-dependent dehydrogenase [Paenibacillus sp. PastH-2]MDH6505495.1 flavin-dependent dehydrogenase [Paenibacillus sp. PastM-3]